MGMKGLVFNIHYTLNSSSTFVLEGPRRKNVIFWKPGPHIFRESIRQISHERESSWGTEQREFKPKVLSNSVSPRTKKLAVGYVNIRELTNSSSAVYYDSEDQCISLYCKVSHPPLQPKESRKIISNKKGHKSIFWDLFLFPFVFGKVWPKSSAK